MYHPLQVHDAIDAVKGRGCLLFKHLPLLMPLQGLDHAPDLVLGLLNQAVRTLSVGVLIGRRNTHDLKVEIRSTHCRRGSAMPAITDRDCHEHK